MLGLVTNAILDPGVLTQTCTVPHIPEKYCIGDMVIKLYIVDDESI